MIERKIAVDFKEIEGFLKGVLSGTEIGSGDDIKRSQFMKIIYKGLMRLSIVNIINYSKIG